MSRTRSLPTVPSLAFTALLAATLAFLALAGGIARAETLTAGNGIYNVDVNSENGEYTVTTGASHPLGEGLNVLYGDGQPGTTFDSIHSYTSGTDYELPDVSTQSTVPLGTTGFQTTYALSRPEAEDDLSVVQTVRADGSTFADSRVEVTTVLTNTGTAPVQIGVRYLWDYQINEDDGPTFQADDPDGPVLLGEQDFPSPSFDHYTIEDNDVSPAPPTFDVLGTVTGPPGAEAVPPTLLQNASWAESHGTAFDYTTVPGRIVSVEGGEFNDNAVLYYWGDDAGDAPTIAPGASYRVSASMYLTRPHEGLPHETPPPAPPAATPAPASPAAPAVTITSGPRRETTAGDAAFTFTGTAGGSFECALDGGHWKPCSSGQAYSHLAPGDHLFQVRETLDGKTSAPASYRWTVDLPRKCVLRVARARVFAYAKHDKARLVIHYTSWRPAKVTVAYALKGSKGALELGTARAGFKKAGVFRLPERLSAAATARLRAAKSFVVRFKIPKTPKSCGRYYAKRLTIPRKVSGQTVWFQSDSRFAPGG
ncbi:MAG TPA: hypothetical protein VHB53_11380 [Solirubrobacterales bacterium]|nr:hypothetical protein [Solirubrobacterales bacterium]